MKPIIGVSAWHHSTPPPWDKAERRIRIEAIRQISFASIIEKAKAEQRTEAPHQNEGDAP